MDSNARTKRLKRKHKYIYPLTKKARKLFSNRAKPYPKTITEDKYEI